MKFNIYRAGEDELIDGCRRGDRSAQKRLYDTYAPRMYTVCCRYLKDPMHAEDALVTAFTRVLAKMDQYKGEGSLDGWIKTIVIREALTILRRNRRLVAETDLEDMEDHRAIASSTGDPLESEDLLKMIDMLPTGYRTVFNLYAIDGYSHREIAEKLQISENTSKSQLSRARVFLQKLLAKHDIHHTQTRNDATTR